MIRDTLHQLLEDEGYYVEQAPDGVVALNTLRTTTRRMVVLLDVMMPRLDGYGVLQAVTHDDWLRRQHRYIVMTASTGSLTAAFTQLMEQISAPALIKSFSIEQLLSALAAAARELAS